MKQRIIALLGISGVGKTTFLRRAQQEMAFQHLTAGTLIASARDVDVDRDLLRFQQIHHNQQRLLAGMAIMKDPNADLIVLDGHAVIDSAVGLVSVGHQVFGSLGVCGIAHLEAEPALIKRNRDNDSSRDRPHHDTEELYRHQEISAGVSQRIADTLAVPFVRLADDMAAFLAFARQAIATSEP
jgi:adenylate kinase